MHVLKGKRPMSDGWVLRGCRMDLALWEHPQLGLQVMTALPCLDDRGWVFHLALTTLHGTRADDAHLAAVLRDFDMPDAHENNAGSTNDTRHFWLIAHAFAS